MKTFVAGLLLSLALGCATNKNATPDDAKATETSAATADAGTVDVSRRGMSCPDGVCGEGLECRHYYGFAGPRGPEMTQCVLPCGAKGQCPSGEACITVNDGPGRICAPSDGKPADAPADR